MAGLEANVLLRTVDYHGDPRTSGGDPVTVNARYDTSPVEPIPCHIYDLDDGTYRFIFLIL